MRHIDIEDDDVWGHARCFLYRLPTVIGKVDNASAQLEKLSDAPRSSVIVINNENAQRGTRSLDIARMRNCCNGRIVVEQRKAD